MRKNSFLALALALAVLLCGCVAAGGGAETTGGGTTQGGETTAGPNPTDPPAHDKRDAIPFAEGQLYAAAYLGYQEMDDFDYYAEKVPGHGGRTHLHRLGRGLLPHHPPV